MREAIGGTWLYGMVIVFIVVFSAYLAISINYSRTFRVKNGVVDIIEQNEGITGDTEKTLETFLDQHGHLVVGNCGSANTKAYKGAPYALMNGKPRLCAYKVDTPRSTSAVPVYTYYVSVFFRIDIPLLGDLLVLPVSGETKDIYFAK